MNLMSSVADVYLGRSIMEGCGAPFNYSSLGNRA